MNTTRPTTHKHLSHHRFPTPPGPGSVSVTFPSPQQNKKRQDQAEAGGNRCALKPHAPQKSISSRTDLSANLFRRGPRKTMSIRINATVNEARAAAGHNKEQWDRFYFITKDEAKRLSEAHPDWTRWILIPANEKETMLERINDRLAAEDIPAVEMIILKWRMSQLLRDIQRKYAEGTMLQGYSSSNMPQAQPDTSQSPHPETFESRPYDPIRDV